MDISRSDLDEGEISEDEPQNPSHTQSAARSNDGEDMYEPPTVIDVNQISAPRPLSPQGHLSTVYEDEVQALSSSPPVKRSESITKHANPEEPMVSSPTNHDNTHTEKIDDDLVSTESSKDTDESDGYEPPEPVSPTERSNTDNEILPQDTQADQLSPTDQRPMPVAKSKTQANTTVADPQPESLTEV